MVDFNAVMATDEHVKDRANNSGKVFRRGSLPATLDALDIGESHAVAKRIDKGDMPFFSRKLATADIYGSISSTVARLHQLTDKRFTLERGMFVTESDDLMVCVVATRIDPELQFNDGLDDSDDPGRPLGRHDL